MDWIRQHFYSEPRPWCERLQSPSLLPCINGGQIHRTVPLYYPLTIKRIFLATSLVCFSSQRCRPRCRRSFITRPVIIVLFSHPRWNRCVTSGRDIASSYSINNAHVTVDNDSPGIFLPNARRLSRIYRWLLILIWNYTEFISYLGTVRHLFPRECRRWWWSRPLHYAPAGVRRYNKAYHIFRLRHIQNTDEISGYSRWIDWYYNA